MFGISFKLSLNFKQISVGMLTPSPILSISLILALIRHTYPFQKKSKKEKNKKNLSFVFKQLYLGMILRNTPQDF